MTTRTVRRHGHLVGGSPHQLETRDITGVEIFAVGTWNGDEYTAEDLQQIVTNFAELKGRIDPPVKLGHNEDQKFLEREGYPAAGWVDKVYMWGDKLVADLVGVPAKIADLIDVQAYRKVSAEIWWNFGELGGKTYDKVLKAIAFLGEEIPAVADIGDITGLYQKLYGTEVVPVAVSKYASAHPARIATYEVDDAAKGDPAAAALLEELRKVAEKAKKGSAGKKGAPRFRTWLDEAIASLGRVLNVKENAVDDDSYEDKRAEIQEALNAKYGDRLGADPIWIIETRDDFVVVRRGYDELDCWMVPYTDNEETETIELGEPVPVERGPWVPKAGATASLARTLARHTMETADTEPSWSSVDKSELPREAFADRGEPDKKSTWRFPHHHVKGETLYAHKGGIRAALQALGGARTGDKPDASKSTRDHLAAHAKAAGIGEDKSKENDMADLKNIAKVLGLSDDADEAAIVAAIGEAKKGGAELAELRTEIGTFREERAVAAATTSVENAIKAKKLAPAQREWATAYARKDPEGFKAYVEKTPQIFGGPAGSDNDAPEGGELGELNKLALEKSRTEKVSYSEALRTVAQEHPELADAYETATAARN